MELYMSLLPLLLLLLLQNSKTEEIDDNCVFSPWEA